MAHCLSKLRPDWEVRSAGTHCSALNAIVPKAWRACVPGWADEHRSRKVTPEDVAWADVVVGVQQSHAAAARAIRPDARVVIFRLTDPAFRPVAEWPALAELVVASADAIAAEVETAAC